MSKQEKSLKQTKISVQLHANNSDTLFNQKSLVHREVGFTQWHTHTNRKTHTHTQQTYIVTNRLNGTNGQSSEKRTALYRKITKNQIGKESIHCSHILEVLAARGVLAEWA